MNSLQNAANLSHCYQDSHLMVDFQLETVELDGQLLELTRKEFDLLALLVRRAGEPIPRPILLMLVWGYGVEIQTRTLDVHIRRLRKNLGTHTVHPNRLRCRLSFPAQPLTGAHPSLAGAISAVVK